MTTNWYDTREGIQEAVNKGIAGLRELAKARHEAGYDRKERLSEWCVYGLFWTDTCGNFSRMVDSAPRSRVREVEIPDVMDKAEVMEITPRFSAVMGYAIPPVVEKCDRCLRGWDMRNISDYYAPQRQQDPHRHKSCKALAIIEDEQAFFKEVLDRSEMPYTAMRAIPNEYYTDPTYFGPWFIVDTEWGALRIGYRKRVINIDWSGTQINHNGDITFKDEGVTVGRTMIHAWGKDKAIEYLRTLAKGNEVPDAA
jgi:hypothetical protein